uniref:Uncharacterized protein n=1 Tax=Branchiostoma floridae TaxID=7739 RepID=C3Y1D8_BRAFL|eukprot:XP_002609668.1 hypothetical protein BRAFLDRAFT_83672 [Branchiostoma floridae]
MDIGGGLRPGVTFTPLQESLSRTETIDAAVARPTDLHLNARHAKPRKGTRPRHALATRRHRPGVGVSRCVGAICPTQVCTGKENQRNFRPSACPAHDHPRALSKAPPLWQWTEIVTTGEIQSTPPTLDPLFQGSRLEHLSIITTLPSHTVLRPSAPD